MLLVLFDVDGTLLLSHDPLVGEAMVHAAREVFGVEVDASAIAPGETALRQGRELGVPGPDLTRWCARVGERYVELLTRADTSGWHGPEGVEATLHEVAATAKVALLTGNPEAVAWARMERIGLARFFARGEGAFGCEAEDTVAVGDTPLDVAGAHAAGIRVVAVESHRFGAAELADADVRIGALALLPEVLASGTLNGYPGA